MQNAIRCTIERDGMTYSGLLRPVGERSQVRIAYCSGRHRRRLRSRTCGAIWNGWVVRRRCSGMSKDKDGSEYLNVSELIGALNALPEEYKNLPVCALEEV